MTGNYQIRQGTVYRKKADGSRLLLIHHNPMNLESLVIPCGGEGDFDVRRCMLVSIDALISLRKSGEYVEEGDLDASVLRQILKELLVCGVLTEDAAKLVAEIEKSLPR